MNESNTGTFETSPYASLEMNLSNPYMPIVIEVHYMPIRVLQFHPAKNFLQMSLQLEGKGTTVRISSNSMPPTPPPSTPQTKQKTQQAKDLVDASRMSYMQIKPSFSHMGLSLN